MPDPKNAESLFLEQLGWINRVATMTCNQHGVWGPEAEDFAASIRLKLMEDNYAIIRKHRGEATLKTYLTVVVQRKFLDYWRASRGRWRPSAIARRLGPPAPDLEALVYRDGFRLDQAGEMLRTSGRTSLSDRDLGALLKELPPRKPRHREVSAHEVAEITEADERTDYELVSDDRYSWEQVSENLRRKDRALQAFGSPTFWKGWAELLLRGTEAKNQITELVGGLLSYSDAAAVLGISVPDVEQRMNRHELLAVPLARGQWGFPARQFDAGGNVRLGVTELAKAGAALEPWTVLSVLMDDVPDGSGILLEHLDDPVVLRDAIRRLETYGEHVAG
jgi:DNA-directed RNA polymerase specialized sigma24 family protein